VYKASSDPSDEAVSALRHSDEAADFSRMSTASRVARIQDLATRGRPALWLLAAGAKPTKGSNHGRPEASSVLPSKP
jgi:hypothetical protein